MEPTATVEIQPDQFAHEVLVVLGYEPDPTCPTPGQTAGQWELYNDGVSTGLTGTDLAGIIIIDLKPYVPVNSVNPDDYDGFEVEYTVTDACGTSTVATTAITDVIAFIGSDSSMCEIGCGTITADTPEEVKPKLIVPRTGLDSLVGKFRTPRAAASTEEQALSNLGMEIGRQPYGIVTQYADFYVTGYSSIYCQGDTWFIEPIIQGCWKPKSVLSESGGIAIYNGTVPGSYFPAPFPSDPAETYAVEVAEPILSASESFCTTNEPNYQLTGQILSPPKAPTPPLFMWDNTIDPKIYHVPGPGWVLERIDISSIICDFSGSKRVWAGTNHWTYKQQFKPG